MPTWRAPVGEGPRLEAEQAVDSVGAHESDRFEEGLGERRCPVGEAARVASSRQLALGP